MKIHILLSLMECLIDQKMFLIKMRSYFVDKPFYLYRSKLQMKVAHIDLQIDSISKRVSEIRKMINENVE